MSPTGTKRTSQLHGEMSAIGSKADMARTLGNVCFGSKADMGFAELLLR